MLKSITLMVTLLSASGQLFADYYVDSINGDDNNQGTINLPFKSLSKINNLNRSTEKIYLARGSEWYETLYLWTDGTTNQVSVSPYGNGPEPVINGSALLQNLAQPTPAGHDFSDNFESGFINNHWIPNGSIEVIQSGAYINNGYLASDASNTDTITIQGGDYTSEFDIGRMIYNFSDDTLHTIQSGKFVSGNTVLSITPHATTSFANQIVQASEPVVSSYGNNNGLMMLRIPVGQNYLTYPLIKPTNTIWIEFDIRTVANPSSAAIRNYAINFYDENDKLGARVRLQGNGISSKLTIHSAALNNIKSEAEGNTPGEWIHVKIHIAVNSFSDPISTSASDTSGRLRIWKNNQLVVDLDGDDNGIAGQFGYVSGLKNQLRFKFITIGSNQSESAEPMYIDNVRISSSELDGRSDLWMQTVPNLITDGDNTDFPGLFIDGAENFLRQNNLENVNGEGKWYYDPVSDQLYVFDNPDGHLIEMPYRKGINLRKGLSLAKHHVISNLEIKQCLTGVSAGTLSSATDSINNITLDNLYIHDNTYAGIGMVYFVRDFIIKNSEISRVNHGGIVSNFRTNEGKAPSFSVINSVIDSSGLEGIALEKSDGAKIIGNKISNTFVSTTVDPIRGHGIDIQNNPGQQLGVVEIYNNTIINNERFGIWIGNTSGLQPEAIRIKNNVIVSSSSAKTIGGNSGVLTPDIDYNVTYNPDNSHSFYWNGNRTFENWQLNYNFDLNGLNTDPELNTDDTLTGTSPLINAGTDPFSDGDGDQYDLSKILIWSDTLNSPVGPWLDGIEIGAYSFMRNNGLDNDLDGVITPP